MVVLEFLESLSNRELAVLIWTLIIVYVVTSWRKIGTSINNLIFSVFHKKIVLIAIAILIYYSSYALVYDSFFHLYYSNFKTFALWVTFVGLPLGFRSIDKKSTHELIKIIPSIIKSTIVLEFLINTNALPLAVELIIIPFFTLVVLIADYLSYNNQKEPASKFMERLSGFLGIVFLAYTVNEILQMKTYGLTETTISDLVIPVILTSVSYPIMYLIALYSSYEHVFLRLKTISQSSNIRLNIKLKFLFEIKLNLNRIQRIQRALNPFFDKSIDELLVTIQAIK